jgi:hypothetical protein
MLHGFSKCGMTEVLVLARPQLETNRESYVIPDLPKANYQVFVRGYELVDSDRLQGAPGKILKPGELTVVVKFLLV